MWRHPYLHTWVSSLPEGYFCVWANVYAYSSPLPCKTVATQIAQTKVKTFIFWRSTFQRSICTRFRSGMAVKFYPPVVPWCTTKVKDRGAIRWFNRCESLAYRTLNSDVELCEAVWRLTYRITGLVAGLVAGLTALLSQCVIHRPLHMFHIDLSLNVKTEKSRRIAVCKFKYFLKCLFGQTGRAKLVPLYLQVVEVWNPSNVCAQSFLVYLQILRSQGDEIIVIKTDFKNSGMCCCGHHQPSH